MESAGLTREGLAAAAKVKTRTVYRWLAGRSTPRSADTVVRVARALGRSAEDLFGVQDPVQPTGKAA